MLDPQKGGHFVISPSDTYSTSKQEYYENTNVLRTEFMTAQGTLEVVDWMHMNNFSFVEEEQHRLPALYRLIRCTAGTVECRIQYCPKFDYARARTILTPVSYGLLAHGALEEAHLFTHCAFSIVDEVAEATVTLQSGQDLSFICAYGKVARDELPPPSRSLEQTIHFWQRWSSECEAGNCLALPLWKKQVTRSALVLKVLAGGKGIAAAATTSLPEVLGGSDNWDYRFNWIRDTSFTIQALASLGHLSDAKEFLDWITNSLFTANQKPSDLKVLYPLYDFPHQKEEELTHLSLVEAWFAIGSYRGGHTHSFAAWLARIATNSCYDELRRRQRRPENAFSQLSENEVIFLFAQKSGDKVGDEVEAKLISRDLAEKLLSTLEPDDRKVFLLLKSGNYSVAEIARNIGWTETKVKMRIHRSRAILQRKSRRLL